MDARGASTWSGGMVGEVGFGKAGQPKKPLGRFLEPTYKLLEWRSAKEGSYAWNLADGLSFPWQFLPNVPWVTTTTVFFKGKLIERLMAPKERCQLLDVQPQWGCPLIEIMWGWESGWVLPCQLYMEFLMS
jgi:hypothetical protein